MGTSVSRWTRRAFLLTGSAACGIQAQSAKGTVFEKDWRRCSDPTTEFEVLRLTNPEYASRMPAYYTRSIAHHNGFLLFSCDRTAQMQAFRMDLKSGQTRQLTSPAELDGESLALMPDERGFCYFDGASLRYSTISGQREREIYRVPEGWKRTEGASISSDGLRASFAEANGSNSRLRVVSIPRGTAE